MGSFDPASFQLRARGHLYEDFEVGQRFDHHWGRTLTQGDGILFSTLAMRYCPLYFNAEYAKGQGHRDSVVDPLLVLATVIGLSVEDLSEIGGPFLGVNSVEFHEAIYPGDTITCGSEVVGKRDSESRPDTGIVTWRTKAQNQHGSMVLAYERTNLVAKRRT